VLKGMDLKLLVLVVLATWRQTEKRERIDVLRYNELALLSAVCFLGIFWS
jgi:hypothetical protein